MVQNLNKIMKRLSLGSSLALTIGAGIQPFFQELHAYPDFRRAAEARGIDGPDIGFLRVLGEDSDQLPRVEVGLYIPYGTQENAMPVYRPFVGDFPVVCR